MFFYHPLPNLIKILVNCHSSRLAHISTYSIRLHRLCHHCHFIFNLLIILHIFKFYNAKILLISPRAARCEKYFSYFCIKIFIMTSHRILFICHGNICRSPMAEFILKDMVEKAGRAEEFEIASAATSTEEIGNDIYPPAKRILTQKGIKFNSRQAR